MSNKKLDDSKRKLLKSAAVGGGAVSLTALPKKWTHPIVASVVLPAHAEQSGTGSLGSIGNCPTENTYIGKETGQTTTCVATATPRSITQSMTQTYGTCLDGSPLSMSMTMMYNLGSGKLTENMSWDKYCGPTHIAEGLYKLQATYSGTGTCGGTASKNYTGNYQVSKYFCTLLAPEIDSKNLKAAISKGKAKLKGN